MRSWSGFAMSQARPERQFSQTVLSHPSRNRQLRLEVRLRPGGRLSLPRPSRGRLAAPPPGRRQVGGASEPFLPPGRLTAMTRQNPTRMLPSNHLTSQPQSGMMESGDETRTARFAGLIPDMLTLGGRHGQAHQVLITVRGNTSQSFVPRSAACGQGQSLRPASPCTARSYKTRLRAS